MLGSQVCTTVPARLKTVNMVQNVEDHTFCSSQTNANYFFACSPAANPTFRSHSINEKHENSKCESPELFPARNFWKEKVRDFLEVKAKPLYPVTTSLDCSRGFCFSSPGTSFCKSGTWHLNLLLGFVAFQIHLHWSFS